jgi:hypothetical protein
VPCSEADVEIEVKYPLVESRLIPLDSNNNPDFTKTMPIGFVATAKKTDVFGEQCTDANCQVSYRISGDPVMVPAAWDAFSQSWKGERISNDLLCDSDYTFEVQAKYSDKEGSDCSTIHINCDPALIVQAAGEISLSPEKRVVLNQKNIDAFIATIYDPAGRTYDLTMTNNDPSQPYLFAVGSPWLEFVYPGPPATCTPPSCTPLISELHNIKTWDDLDVDGVIDTDEMLTPKVTIKLTDYASTREGDHPILFTATSSVTRNGIGVLIVTGEALSEFPLWHLGALLFLGTIIFALVSQRTGKRKSA